MMSKLPHMPVDFAEVRRRRQELGFTMDECAQRAAKYLASIGSDKKKKPFFDRGKWNNFEVGLFPDPRISTIQAVAHALTCKVEDLLAK